MSTSSIGFKNVAEAASVVSDVNSIVRNGVQAAQLAVPSPFINGSSALGGVLGIPIGLSLVRDGVTKGKAAYDCGDVAGVAHNALFGTCGAAFAGVSSLMVTGGAMGLQGVSAPRAFTPAFSGLGLGMSAALLGFSGYSLIETTRFRNAMKKASSEGGERAVLAYLNRQISLSPKERVGKSDPEITKALQKKWNALERRVGSVQAVAIREAVPLLLQTFDPGEAKALILAVDKASFKQRVKHVTFFAIGIITALASVAFLLMTGPWSSILFAIGAVLWLTVDSSKLHEFIGEKCWALYSKWNKQEPLPCLTTS